MEAATRRKPLPRLQSAAIVFPTIVLLTIGCRTVGHNGDPTMAADRGLKGPPGTDAETQEYFNKKIHFRAWHDNVNARLNSGGAPVTFRIKPETSVHNRSWYEALRSQIADGAIVARIENRERKNVPELGLTTSDEFAYMWVGPLDPQRTRRGVAFYTFDNTGKVSRKGELTIDSVTICKDFSGKRPGVKINPSHGSAECELVTGLGASATASRTAGQLASYTPEPKRRLAPGGLWVSCSGGCCDIGDGAFY